VIYLFESWLDCKRNLCNPSRGLATLIYIGRTTRGEGVMNVGNANKSWINCANVMHDQEAGFFDSCVKCEMRMCGNRDYEGRDVR
jgi:hypothetical protein